MKRKMLMRVMACTLAASLFAQTVYPGGAGVETVWAEETAEIQAKAAYSFDSASTWDNNGGKENNLLLMTASAPAEGTALVMDVLLPGDAAPSYGGIIKPVGVLRIGSGWNWVQSNVIPELKSEDFKENINIDGKSYYKASVRIPFEDTVGANDKDGNWNGQMKYQDAVNDAAAQVTVQFAGYLCDYSGEIAIANARLEEPEAAGDVLVKSWDFDDGIGGWENAGWNYQYDGAEVTAEPEKGMLKVNVDYSKSGDCSWSQIGVREWGSVDLAGATKTSFDLYYDPAKMTGALSVKEVLQYQDGSDYPSAVEEAAGVDFAGAVDADVEGLSGWKKVKVELSFDPVSKNICNVVLCLVGVNTTYSGAVYIDNLEMKKAVETVDIFVDATQKPVDAKELSVSGNALKAFDKEGKETTTPLAKSVKLADAQADDGTKAVYAYLEAAGASRCVLFGHQNDTWHKAGSAELSCSDTLDVTGSLPGVIGLDVLSLVGNEYSAARYNSELASGDAQKLPETAQGNVMAAAALTNRNIADGAIITLSAHMPNFSLVKEAEGYHADTDPSYAKYDFSGYTPNVLSGDVMNNILPGGSYHEVYTAYLDLIADYASRVDGTILFRPFHENTGSWFWWGKAFCNASTYKNVYRYTVEYLRDEKDIHNLIYVYGPGSEAASVEEYGERYPGDAFVDMVGFDMYHSAPKEDDSWFDSFKAELALVDQFASAHGKLVAVTETGVANSADKGDNQTALHKTGNEQKDWYNRMLEAVSDTNASYFLLWANFSEKDGFYTPYVKSVKADGTLHGHEMLDQFIDFYNDLRSVFSVDQKKLLGELKTVVKPQAVPVSDAPSGYITAPVGGKRILEATALGARVANQGTDTAVSFLCVNGQKQVKLTPSGAGSIRQAQLDASQLAALGEGVGSIQLLADESVVDEISVIFNMPEPEKDPYEIDGFENYFGENSLLQKEWATNKDSGCTIDISLSKEGGTFCEGGYSLKFSYQEKVGGWAGATIKKEVDWSGCNALQLWTIPDGKNQKVVIQITAGGKEYEAYLNTYDAYKDQTTPFLVTIPFSEFKDRDGDGPEGGLVELSGQVESFGLWVNQIGSEEKSGVIYYDKITAVSSDATAVTFVSAKPGDSGDDGGNGDASGNGNASGNGAGGSGDASGNDASGSGNTSKEDNGGNGNAGESGNSGSGKDSGSSNSGSGKDSGSSNSGSGKDNGSSNSGSGKDNGNTAAGKTTARKASGISGVKSSYSKAVNAKSFTLKAKGKGAVTYVSSDKKIVTVGKKSGKVTVKGIGVAAITVKSAGTSRYKGASKKITITIVPKKTVSVKAVSNKKGKTTVTWGKQSNVTGYQIQYSLNKSFKKFSSKTVKGAAKKSATIKGLKSGKKYYVRVRAYKKSGSKTLYGAWSSVKTVKVK